MSPINTKKPEVEPMEELAAEPNKKSKSTGGRHKTLLQRVTNANTEQDAKAAHGLGVCQAA